MSPTGIPRNVLHLSCWGILSRSFEWSLINKRPSSNSKAAVVPCHLTCFDTSDTDPLLKWYDIFLWFCPVLLSSSSLSSFSSLSFLLSFPLRFFYFLFISIVICLPLYFFFFFSFFSLFFFLGQREHWERHHCNSNPNQSALRSCSAVLLSQVSSYPWL